MKKMYSWRKLRNLVILLFFCGGSLWGLLLALDHPLHWIWTLPLMLLTYRVWLAWAFTHPHRQRYWGPAAPGFASPVYEKVLFQTRDGLTLFSWFLPGRSRAAVILVHGLSASGLAMQLHADFLLRLGYSVLMIDLRAHGSSDGNISTSGVLEAFDVVAAADYLRARPEVDPDRIGLLGISLGAQAGLRGALLSEHIRALVLEGLGPADLRDRLLPAEGRNRSIWLKLRNRLVYAQAQFEQWLVNSMSGQHPAPVLEVIAGLRPRPLLLIACGRYEIEFNRRFSAAAGEGCSLWELPRARHAAAYIQDRHEYQRRVGAFFEHTLRPGRESQVVPAK